MAVRQIYLRIERIEDYSPVAPMLKVAAPIQYGRDCLRGIGHPNGVIPPAEIEARSIDAVVYREYEDPDYLIPVVDKIVDADINEPIYSRRVPGAVIWAHPGDVLEITVLNADNEPHSFHVHGLTYGIDSDGSWPFGTMAADGRRSDEICPGQSWTYRFEMGKDAVGAWPFHDHWKHTAESVNRGLFGGIVVTERRARPPFLVLPDNVRDLLEDLRRRIPRRWPPIPVPGPPPRRPLPDPPDLLPGAVRPRLDIGDRIGHVHDAIVPHRAEPPRLPARPVSPPPPLAGAAQDFRRRVDEVGHLIDEFALGGLVRPVPKPERLPTLHAPIFLHVLRDDHAVPLFDSGDIEEMTGVFELDFADAGTFEYFCRYHPVMQGTIEVVPGGPAAVTVNIVDAPAMGFSPPTVTIGVGGTVRWENHSMQHHTVTSRQGATMATHCLNGRGFVGNTPTVVAYAGQRIRWYVFNLDLGTEWHNFHPHALRWTFAGQTVDVRSLGPAESFVAETVAPPAFLLPEEMAEIQDPEKRPEGAKRRDLVGDFVFHCHVHHHMMNGMIGIVRSRQSVWLTDEMVDELKATRGFPEDTGSNACPDVDETGCAGKGLGRLELVPGDPEVVFMHSMLVPQKDKVLFWGETRPDQSRLWDYSVDPGMYAPPANQPADVTAAAAPFTPADASNLWSAEHEYLDTPDGAVLAHGGLYPPPPKRAYVFDAASELWAKVQDTTDDRFYSSTFSLEDGRVITLYGSASKSVEIYTHGTGWSAPVLLHPDLHIYASYPWAFLLPDGRIFIAGPEHPTHRFDPAALGSAPESFVTTYGGSRDTGSAQNGTAVLLPLRPPDYRARILIAGGYNGGELDSTEVIDLGAPAPAWAALPPMHHVRGNLTGVLLPTGQVVVAGGILGGADGGPVEIIDPESSSAAWLEGPSLVHIRGYHSSFLLLRDGSVLGGGNPAGPPNPLERYYPWYMDLPRPTIANAPPSVGYGETFTITTPDAGAIVEVVLMRPGAVTHGFNMTQRAVELTIDATAAGSVDVVSPPNGRIAPPGWHLLFVLDASRVPSTGRWLRLTSSP